MAWLSFGKSGSVRRATVKRSQATPAPVRDRGIGELMRCAVSSVLIINAHVGSWRPPTYSMQEKPMTKFALYVPLQAKPGKEKEVSDFLRSAVPLVNAEAGTVSWFAIQEGPSSFAIFDTFDDEAGRDAHLNGKVAAALMEKAKAGDLFAKAPEIYKL